MGSGVCLSEKAGVPQGNPTHFPCDTAVRFLEHHPGSIRSPHFWIDGAEGCYMSNIVENLFRGGCAPACVCAPFGIAGYTVGRDFLKKMQIPARIRERGGRRSRLPARFWQRGQCRCVAETRCNDVGRSGDINCRQTTSKSIRAALFRRRAPRCRRRCL